MLASLARWIEKAPPIRTAWISFHAIRYLGSLEPCRSALNLPYARGARLMGKVGSRGDPAMAALQS
jgi:hypothetical protein